MNFLISVFFCSLGILISYFCRELGGYESTYYAGVSILIWLMNLLMPWPPVYSVVNSAILYVSYLLLAYTSNFSLPAFVNNNYFLASAIIVALISHYLAEKLRFREFVGRLELKQANTQLHSLDQAKTRFFSNITHEFRTPLVSLSATVQLIRGKELGDPALEGLLANSQASLEDMLENVNDLLIKTRSEKGLVEMRWAEIDIVDFLEKAVAVFMPLAAKQGNRLSFKNRIPNHSPSDNSPLPPLNLRGGVGGGGLMIYADRRKLKKIVNNLVGNAMKFTQNGEIEVGVEVEVEKIPPTPPFAKGGTSVRAGSCLIRVRDTGLGIPEEDIPTLFDPFTQAGNNALREAQGTGLGLAMVKDFVEKHGGTVRVESELGKGSVFTVALPLGDAHVDRTQLDSGEIVEDDSDTSVHLGIKSFADLDLSLFASGNPDRPTLLLVEDNPQILQVLAYVLKDFYNLSFAKDGAEGVEKIKTHKPDLVISDIMMPRMNGYELIRAVRDDPDLKTTPIILLTSKADLESKLRGFREGADEYLSKPFNNQEVLTRVKSLIEKRRMEVEFIHAEKMISLGQLVAGVAHEINNPIAYAKSAAQKVSRIYDKVEKGELSLEAAKQYLTENAKEILDGIERVATITAALKGLVRQGAQGFTSNDIHHGLDSSLAIARGNQKTAIRFHKDYALGEKLVCNMNQLNQVFLNLLQNAANALEAQGSGDVWIRTYRDGEHAVVAIRDSGPGIPENVQNRIFDPFFTTKDVGQGMGLGLYISRKIVDEHGGTLSLASIPGQGAEFSIRLPLFGNGGQHAGGSEFLAAGDRGVEAVHYPYRR